MKKNYFFIYVITLLIIFTVTSYSQVRVAVLPFQNINGLMSLNKWSYKLQDSLYKALKEQDPNGKSYQLVPSDSIESALAELNLNPTNPQYQTDMWKVVKKLNIQKVVSGNFDIQSNRYLINCYIYDIDTKLPDNRFQARDIIKKEETIMDAIAIIIDRLLPGLKSM